MLDFDMLSTDLATANAYHSRLGHSAWTGVDADKIAALWRGQAYVAGRYNDRWLSSFDPDDAPIEVQYAIAEAALSELTTPGTLSPDYVAARVVTEESKSVGPLTKSVKYASATSIDGVMPRLAAIDALLKRLVRQRGAGSVDLLRV